MKRSAICIGFVAILFGCTPIDEQAPDKEGGRIVIKPEVSDESSDTEGAIAEAARSATKSLETLAKLQYATQEKLDDSYKQEFSIELSGLASVEYTGPCEPLLNQIAKTAGIKISKVGNPTATSIIISVSANSAPLSEIVQNIAYQIQSHARLSFNSETKTLEIIYLNT